MKFSLSDSPLRTIFSRDGSDVYDLVIPFVKEFASQMHEEASTPIPPAAFVLRPQGESLYLNGFSFESFESFMAEVALEATEDSLVITMTELGSVQQDYSKGLILLCVQSSAYYRCQVASLVLDKKYPVFEDPLRIEIESEGEEEGTTSCHLSGLFPLMQPLF